MKDGAVIYCRVSTEEQVDNNSLPVQRRDCVEKAEKLGCEVLEVFVEEGVSGTRHDRPAMARMLAYCTEHSDRIRYVIVKDIDRFSRDVLVYHTLRSQFRTLGIALYSVNQPNIAEGTAEARLLEAMFSGFSQYERDKILQRTLAGTKEVVAKGGWATQAPIGYRPHRTADNVPTLAIVPDEAAAVRKAFELFAEGLNLMDVAARLAELGYRSRRGAPLSFQTVHKVLRKPVYIGKVESRLFPGRQIDGLHVGIIPQDLWDRVQERISGTRPAPARNKLNPAFPLTNVLRCGDCGAPMTGSFSKNRWGRRYGYYHCRKTGCRSRNLPKDAVEQNFGTLLESIKPTAKWTDAFERVALAEWKRRWNSQFEESERLAKRLVDLEARKHRIEAAYFDEKIEEDVYRRHREAVVAEIKATKQARVQAVVSEDALTAMLEFSRQFFTSLSNTWKNGTPERKRFLQTVVFPDGLRCERDGTYRTLSLPPTLELFAASKDDTSLLAALVRKSWNPLLTFMQSLEGFIETSPPIADPAAAA